MRWAPRCGGIPPRRSAGTICDFTEAAAATGSFAGSPRKPFSTGTARHSTCRPARNSWRRRTCAAIRRSASASRVYALQFHLEVTPDIIADWCVQDENCGDVRELGVGDRPVLQCAASGGIVRTSLWKLVRNATIPPMTPPSQTCNTGRIVASQSEFGNGQRSEKESANTKSRTNGKTKPRKKRPEAVSDPERPTCPRCGWHNTRLSHTKDIFDGILRTFSLRAFRCRSCGNRFRRFRRVPKV